MNPTLIWTRILVPREGENMIISPDTPNGYERKMTNIRGQETTATTAEPMQMHSTIDHNESNTRPGICEKYHGSIK